ncbi:MAG: sugar-binding transcriptional regulator [Chloroflexi bacterium]|nr:sugar-binding transcriptional regulator [Chloroflexota bacterium]
MGAYTDLEGLLELRFHLREAVVVEATDYGDQSRVTRELGVAAADHLRRVLQSNDRIVISWGGTLLAMVKALADVPSSSALRNVKVIQGLGGVVDPNHEAHATSLTTSLARALEAQAVLLPAPGVAGSLAAHEALCNDPYVATSLDEACKANLAVMGIGAPRKDSIIMQEGDIVTWRELAELMDRGAVGDINLRYFDDRGQGLSSDLDDRVIGLTLEEIRQIDHVVGVAGGSVKFRAIRGALVGGLIHTLVTDHVTAQRLLDTEAEAG